LSMFSRTVRSTSPGFKKVLRPHCTSNECSTPG
jgi:hypothetical protein